jgi:hypothetical protein
MFANVVSSDEIVVVLINTRWSNYYTLEIENVTRELQQGRHLSKEKQT